MVVNKTIVTQDPGESDADFDSRANAYIDSLAKYRYSWFEQQLPNKNGNPEPRDTTTPSATPQPKGLFQ